MKLENFWGNSSRICEIFIQIILSIVYFFFFRNAVVELPQY